LRGLTPSLFLCKIILLQETYEQEKNFFDSSQYGTFG
jgi:hypothetical protein